MLNKFELNTYSAIPICTKTRIQQFVNQKKFAAGIILPDRASSRRAGVLHGDGRGGDYCVIFFEGLVTPLSGGVAYSNLFPAFNFSRFPSVKTTLTSVT